MADADILFLLTLGKLETQTLVRGLTFEIFRYDGGNFSKISVRLIFTKWQPFFNFFIMAHADIPFLLILGKPETQILRGASSFNFFHIIDIYKMATIFQFFHNG